VALASLADAQLALGVDTLRAIADFDGDRVVDDPSLLAALEEASAFVETFVPADTLQAIDPQNVPKALRRAVVMVANHQLRQSRDQSTDDSRAAYNDALSWLRMLAAGTVKLVGVVVPDPGAGSYDPADSEVEGQPRMWNRASASRVF
jgi:phage gp36-like protein